MTSDSDVGMEFGGEVGASPLGMRTLEKGSGIQERTTGLVWEGHY